MKKSICLILLCVAIAVQLFAGNPVANPGFESGELDLTTEKALPGWIFQKGRAPGELEYLLDTETFHSGKRSLRMSVTKGAKRNARIWSGDFYPVSPGSRVTLTFYYQSHPVEDASKSFVRIQLYDKNKKRLSSNAGKLNWLKNCDTWEKWTMEYTVPDDDHDGYHIGFSFYHTNPGSYLIDDVELDVRPGVGLFKDDVQGLVPPAPATKPTVDGGEFRAAFSEQGYGCKTNSAGVFQVASQGESMEIQSWDGCVVSSLSQGGVYYPAHGQGGLFRDLYWVPESARWDEDSVGRYSFEKISVDDKGYLNLVFTRALTHADLEGLVLEKTYIIEPALRRVSADIKITNKGKEEREFRYWSWHRSDVPAEEAVYQSQGDPEVRAGSGAAQHIFYKPHFSQWVKVGDRYYIGWDRSQERSGGVYLDRVTIWNDAKYPAMGLVGLSSILKPDKKFIARIRFNAITERSAPPEPKTSFKLAHGYGDKKKLFYRASLHNHSMYDPTYWHAPMPTDKVLEHYRDYECKPRYKIVSITEHNRLTLPENTDPKGESDPAWGVEGMLFIPGNELTIGSLWSLSEDGDFFGEINCVNLKTETTNHADQAGYHYRERDRFEAGAYMKHLIEAGAYVGLCHPNASLDGGGVHRWESSGYSFDEIDLVFGNPEKLLPPMEQLPLGLEIGNRGYDLTERSGYKNAEEKWDMLLTRGFRLLGTGSDDTHGKPPCMGWVVAYVNELTREDFMDSLLKGNFYSSQGPEITKIDVSEKTITVATDQPALIEFIGKGGAVFHSEADTLESSYTVKGNEIYIRARVTRECPELKNHVGGGIGHRRSAWTNPFYIE